MVFRIPNLVFEPLLYLICLQVAGMLLDSNETKRSFSEVFTRCYGSLMKDFIADFQKPVAHDGKEHFEYVPTQVVTEYLRSAFSAAARATADVSEPPRPSVVMRP